MTGAEAIDRMGLSRNRAAWTFAAAWAASVAVIAASGHAADLLAVAEALGVLALVVVVAVPLTAGGAPPAWVAAGLAGRRQWVPVVAALAYAAAVPAIALVSARIPAVALLAIAGQAALPLAVALAAGAGWRELGFDRGHRSVAAALALIVPLAAGAGLAGAGVLRGAAAALAGTLVTAAVPEEVHLRGVLMTRLHRLVGRDWAVVGSALVFGAYHATANTGYFAGAPYPAAIALGIAFEGTLGLAFAILAIRTRSLAAPVAVHAVLDAVNFTLLPQAQRLLH